MFNIGDIIRINNNYYRSSLSIDDEFVVVKKNMWVSMD